MRKLAEALNLNSCQIDPFDGFLENMMLAKAFLNDCQYEGLVTLSDVRKIRAFIEQVKGSLPFLPQSADLASPTESALNILSYRIEPKIVGHIHAISSLSPKIILVFAVSSLNAFLSARLEVFEKCGLKYTGRTMPIEGVLSIPRQTIYKALPVRSKLLQELKEIVIMTQSVLAGNAVTERDVRNSKNKNLVLCLDGKTEPTVGQVNDYIERMEEFVRLVNETWLSSK